MLAKITDIFSAHTYGNLVAWPCRLQKELGNVDSHVPDEEGEEQMRGAGVSADYYISVKNYSPPLNCCKKEVVMSKAFSAVQNLS